MSAFLVPQHGLEYGCRVIDRLSACVTAHVFSHHSYTVSEFIVHDELEAPWRGERLIWGSKVKS